MNTENKDEVTIEIGNNASSMLASVNSNSKLKNECLFCKSRFVYERVATQYLRQLSSARVSAKCRLCQLYG